VTLQICKYNLTASCLCPQTNYTTSFALYHLATNSEVQTKLYEESCRLLIEPNSPVTSAILAQAQYMKAVLKESLRLNPISIGIGRILAKDIVLSGYHVPKGVSMQLWSRF
jgi:ecdysteroid 25-hydroxylase CYP302A1